MEQLTTEIRNQQWLQMIQDQKSSGLTVKDWCLENHISENCFYYRQHKLRMAAAGMVSQFVEITRSAGSRQLSQHLENQNINSAASIVSGKVVIGLSNQASEELIRRIVRVLNAQ